MHALGGQVAAGHVGVPAGPVQREAEPGLQAEPHTEAGAQQGGAAGLAGFGFDQGHAGRVAEAEEDQVGEGRQVGTFKGTQQGRRQICLLYTSDAADE